MSKITHDPQDTEASLRAKTDRTEAHGSGRLTPQAVRADLGDRHKDQEHNKVREKDPAGSGTRLLLARTGPHGDFHCYTRGYGKSYFFV